MVIRSRPARGQDWLDYGADLDAAARLVADVGGALSPLTHTHTAAQISDASAFGRSVVKAVDAAAARTLLGVSVGGGGSDTAVGGWPVVDVPAGEAIPNRPDGVLVLWRCENDPLAAGKALPVDLWIQK